MTYAHIFKTGKTYQLIISTGFRPTGTTYTGLTKPVAKAKAIELGAKPWNY